MTPARVKYLVLAAALLAAGGGILAATQTWFALHLVPGAGHDAPVTVPGTAASPALMALSLAALALVGALAIAGRVLRFVLGVLGVLLGGCLILAAALSLGDPASAGAGSVTDVTGVAGSVPVEHLVASVETTAWPLLALAAGILLVLAAVAVLLTGAIWPGSGRRYQAVRFEAAAPEHGSAEEDADPAGRRERAIDAWDDLSRGDDPTA